ncbi:hypothetical protein NIES267_69440 [Calothrix parasitica NIES-267]|uniref:DUF861 domain-containing protein n=1 Tax=Calothrix parasitica NIES-267 TaxID=1973488 RepID=A0A1Z4M1R5_9CYAN|nr:hypothetical protein NIES267_69440 [Calothrix parasitica NIES-267]
MGASCSLSTIISKTIMKIQEDWGGNGRGRMNLSGRSTEISSEHTPRKYQLFDTNKISETEWRINGFPENVISGKRCLLSWHECGASTSKVVLPPQFEAPSGIFTADLEIFILKGTIKIGEWFLDKHCYSFIPAGVLIDDWKVVGDEEVEILWMENGSVPFGYKEAKNNHPDASLSEFIPVL